MIACQVVFEESHQDYLSSNGTLLELAPVWQGNNERSKSKTIKFNNNPMTNMNRRREVRVLLLVPAKNNKKMFSSPNALQWWHKISK